MAGITRRPRRIFTAGVASLGIAGIAAAAAFGHIPGVGNGLAPSTSAPDLRSVTVLQANLDDGDPETARYCFDSGVSAITPAALAAPASYFNIQTYDARKSMNPTTLSPDGNDGNCIVASFANGQDLTQGTVGEVVPGAVQDLQSRKNDLGSEPLAGSVSTPVAGATTGPDLVSAVANTTVSDNKKVAYTFDENIEPGAYPGSAFGFYDAAGNRVSGSAANATIFGRTATVNYGANADLSPATTRFVANQGAVADRSQTFGGSTPSSPGVAVAAGSAPTPRPQVTAATAVSPTDYRVTFNQAVQATGDETGFFAVSDDGTAPPPATSVGPGGNPDTLLVVFPASPVIDQDSTVKILVQAGSVKAASDGITTNVASQAATNTPNAAPGYTNGPDLLAVGVDAPTNRVVYKYDEPVFSLAAPAASAFRAVAADGSVIPAVAGSASVTGQFVTVTYPSTISSAVSFGNFGNTVLDKTTRPNPHQSVSKEIQVGPPVAPPPPSPPVRPGTPPGPVITVKPRARVKVTIKRRGRKYSGRLTSSRKACTQGRRVILKRRGNSRRFGSTKSRRTGTYSIKRRKRLRGRVYVVVTARSSSVVNCLPGRSRTIRG